MPWPLEHLANTTLRPKLLLLQQRQVWISICNAAAAKSLQSCPALCNPIDGCPPGSPVPGILQARTLEWVAISFSSAWKWKVKVKWLSRVRLLATSWSAAYQPPLSMGFSRQEYWSGVPLPSYCLNSTACHIGNCRFLPYVLTGLPPSCLRILNSLSILYSQKHSPNCVDSLLKTFHEFLAFFQHDVQSPPWSSLCLSLQPHLPSLHPLIPFPESTKLLQLSTNAMLDCAPIALMHTTSSAWKILLPTAFSREAPTTPVTLSSHGSLPWTSPTCTLNHAGWGSPGLLYETIWVLISLLE